MLCREIIDVIEGYISKRGSLGLGITLTFGWDALKKK